MRISQQRRYGPHRRLAGGSGILSELERARRGLLGSLQPAVALSRAPAALRIRSPGEVRPSRLRRARLVYRRLREISRDLRGLVQNDGGGRIVLDLLQRLV